ncbi:MAG: hypothetical protein HWD83_04005 [Gammaproteobacteria bacterium]|nr:hypothetical protein [Gammaproteobacteria bacterium]
MNTLTQEQMDSVNGGILINPVTVMLAVQLASAVSPYVTAAAVVTATAVGSAVGTYLAEDGE